MLILIDPFVQTPAHTSARVDQNTRPTRISAGPSQSSKRRLAWNLFLIQDDEQIT
jgi:hypothetical protein